MSKTRLPFSLRTAVLCLLWIYNFSGRQLAPEPGDDGWTQLFNGKDLTGWKQVGKGTHMVENGLIASKGGMGLLYWTKEKFSNCTIKVVYKMQKDNSNSGVFIRIPIEPREEWMPVFYGYEVQIDNHPETSGEDDYHITGTLYSLTKPLGKTRQSGPGMEYDGDNPGWPPYHCNCKW